jgi:hypothetical protein
LKFLSTILLSLSCTIIYSQQNTKVAKLNKEKIDKLIEIPAYYKPQADSLRKKYVADGFELLRAEFIAMESSYERAVMMPLEAGTWYQFVFISDSTAHTQEVFLYDEDERKVMYKKKKWADVDGNIIEEPFIARHSEYHILKFVQESRKKKHLATGLLLFKKTGTGPNLKYRQNRHN